VVTQVFVPAPDPVSVAVLAPAPELLPSIASYVDIRVVGNRMPVVSPVYQAVTMLDVVR
jgi:hypothetical protein